MKTFTINGGPSWYTNTETNAPQQGIFLRRQIQAYYHEDYHSGDATQRTTVGTVENIITTLKNQFKDKSKEVLIQAVADLFVADVALLLVFWYMR